MLYLNDWVGFVSFNLFLAALITFYLLAAFIDTFEEKLNTSMTNYHMFALFLFVFVLLMLFWLILYYFFGFSFMAQDWAPTKRKLIIKEIREFIDAL